MDMKALGEGGNERCGQSVANEECFGGVSLSYGEVREWDVRDTVFGHWKYMDGL